MKFWVCLGTWVQLEVLVSFGAGSFVFHGNSWNFDFVLSSQESEVMNLGQIL